MDVTKLTNKLAHSPWPESPGAVVFLLDASTRFEQQLLRQWVEQHALEDRDYRVVNVPLNDDRKPLQVYPLVQALADLEDAVVAPLRVAWTPSSTAIRSRPRPVDLLWGRDRRPGAFKAQRILRKSPERMHLLAGVPATQSEMAARFETKTALAAEQQVDDFGVFIARQAAIVLDMDERNLQGGRYKVPRYVAQSLRNNKEFRQRLNAIAQATQRSESDVMREVNTYFREMISIPTSFWLDVWATFCNFSLGLGYEPTLHYRSEELEKIRRIVRDYPSALLWTHKTYIDGFVVPKILFDNDFPMPHFFGGANLNFPILGFLMRRAGGIFIKRSFSDNAVYKATLRQYISYLMEKRFPLTWSFEGTRSRLGKLMPPKYGVLKYVLEGCYTADAKAIHIIPVTVSYDLVRDAEEYAREQSGVPKAPESLSWFIGYIRSLAKPMGKIYVDFGEPVVLDQAPDPSDRLALSKVAFQVAVEANRVTPVTVPAIISMALLGVYPRALSEQEISTEVADLVAWTRHRGLRLSQDFDSQYAEGIEQVLKLMIGENIVTRFDGGPTTVYGIKEGRAAVASYYRYTIAHYFVNKAITELCLVAVAEQGESDEAPVTVFWREVEDLRDLFKFEFFYPPTEVFQEEIIAELAAINVDWETQLNRGAQGARQLLLLMTPQIAHMTLQLFAEAYALGAEILASLQPGESMDELDYTERCMNYGRQAFMQRRVSSEVSTSKLLFKNSWSMLSARGLTDESHADFLEGRRAQSETLSRLVRRVEVIRASAIAARGTLTIRDTLRANL